MKSFFLFLTLIFPGLLIAQSRHNPLNEEDQLYINYQSKVTLYGEDIPDQLVSVEVRYVDAETGNTLYVEQHNGMTSPESILDMQLLKGFPVGGSLNDVIDAFSFGDQVEIQLDYFGEGTTVEDYGTYNFTFNAYRSAVTESLEDPIFMNLEIKNETDHVERLRIQQNPNGGYSTTFEGLKTLRDTPLVYHNENAPTVILNYSNYTYPSYTYHWKPADTLDAIAMISAKIIANLNLTLPDSLIDIDLDRLKPSGIHGNWAHFSDNFSGGKISEGIQLDARNDKPNFTIEQNGNWFSGNSRGFQFFTDPFEIKFDFKWQDYGPGIFFGEDTSSIRFELRLDEFGGLFRASGISDDWMNLDAHSLTFKQGSLERSTLNSTGENSLNFELGDDFSSAQLSVPAITNNNDSPKVELSSEFGKILTILLTDEGLSLTKEERDKAKMTVDNEGGWTVILGYDFDHPDDIQKSVLSNKKLTIGPQDKSYLEVEQIKEGGRFKLKTSKEKDGFSAGPSAANPSGGVSALMYNGQTSLAKGGTSQGGSQIFYDKDGNNVLTILHNNDGGASILFVIPGTNTIAGKAEFTKTGGLVFSGDLKNFRMDDPENPTQSINYANLEGPEAGAYERGVARLTDGEVFIPFSEFFKKVINPNSITVVLTPHSAKSKGLAVVEKNTTGFKVKELESGSGNYAFDWEVKGKRIGYEQYDAIRKNPTRVLPNNIDAWTKNIGEKHD